MTEQEAIAKIKSLGDYRYSHYTFIDDNGKALDMAIKALERQIPKPLKSWGACVCCPNCGIVQIIFDNFCPACGQKISEID